MSDEPPRAGQRAPTAQAVHVFRVPKSGTVDVLLLGQWDGILTHRRGSLPCPCPGLKVCDPRAHVKESAWRGYAPCEVWTEGKQHRWVPWVLEITEHLAEIMQGRELRGEVWRIVRQTGQGKYAPVVGELIESRSSAECRPAFDVHGACEVMYDTTFIEWGVEPRFKPKLYLADSHAAPPPGRRGAPIPAADAAAAEHAEAQKLRRVLDEARASGALPTPDKRPPPPAK